MLRVGRITKSNKSPKFEGFVPIVVMTPSSKYGDISPYSLKDPKGRIIENVYQFSKLYKEVPKSKQTYSQWDRKVIWEHPAEVHLRPKVESYSRPVESDQRPNVENDTFEITDEYWAWREKGCNTKYAVRYPVGYHHKKECIGSISEEDLEECATGTEHKIGCVTALSWIEARKKIYLPLYEEAVKRHKTFKVLLEMLRKGKNLLIIEVDGPHQESLQYYIDKYGVAEDFIEDDTMLVTDESIDIMLNDNKHSFGHGYCLAKALRDEL